MSNTPIGTIFQVLVYGTDVNDSDYETTMNYASVPNPLFATMGGAVGFCIEDANRTRRQLLDDIGNEAIPAGHAVLLSMAWTAIDQTMGNDLPPGSMFSFDGETGVTYLICPVKVAP